jgi:hypothetical protein
VLEERLRRTFASPVLLVAAFGLVSAVCATRHELWLDEANPWVIARDAHSLGGLWFNMRFEPHPPLWYVLLFLVSRVTSNPAAMQALHALIATGAVAILAWFAPFRARERWLLAFSYYLLFEYGVINRGYALGLLLAFALVALMTRRRGGPVWIGVLLAALANTSAFGLILSGALLIGWVFARSWAGRPAGRLAVSAVIYAAGAALSLYSMLPRGENVYGRNTHLAWSGDRLVHTLDLFWAAFLPLPDVRAASPWNSNLFLTAPIWGHGDLLHHIIAVAAVVLCGIVLWSLRGSAPAALVFVAGEAAVTALLYVEYSGGYRHHGHYFVLFVLAFWWASARSGEGGARLRGAHVLLTTALVIHVLAAAYFVAADARRPFSSSLEVARFVGRLPAHAVAVVAQPQFLSYIGPPLSAYARRPVYYADSRGVERGSYLVYDRVHKAGTGEEQILRDVAELSDRFGVDVYVVANHWTPTVFGAPVATFSDHLVPDEQVSAIYRFHTALDAGRVAALTSARGSKRAHPSG